MGMRFVINLTERDLNFFRQALKKSRDAVRHADESEIIEAIGDVLAEIKQQQPLPDFVERRIPELESLIRMLQDDEWALPEDARERLLATFAYFGDPEDILPDHIPVIGYLDDVIMIELVANDEFRSHVDVLAGNRILFHRSCSNLSMADPGDRVGVCPQVQIEE